MKENYLREDIFFKDGLLFVSEYHWDLVKKNHDRQEVQDYLHSLIHKYDIPFPYREYTDLELKDEFSRLKNTHHYSIVSYTKWDSHRLCVKDFKFTYGGEYLSLNRNILGRSCSDQFTQDERMKCSSSNFTSPMLSWRKHKYIFRFLYNVEKRVNSSSLRASLAHTVYIASQFSPMCAKAIYDMFDCKNVLDLSMGWGDRLIGALASNIDSYTGIDPNSAIHPKYEEISKFYKHNKRTKFICSPAEDADLEPNQFDMIFTSPPYFDREKYSDEDTQSWKRYGSSVDKWLNGFLFPVMQKSYDWLQDGGRLILNINDVSNAPFCQRMLNYATSLGFNYEGVIGYEMSSRRGSNTLEEDAVYEPIFVWVKGTPKNKIQLEPMGTLF